MKLVLCSEGFRTPNTVAACVGLCDKPQDEISVAIINEGYAVEQGDKRWVIDNLNDVANNFAHIDIVDLLALTLEEVEARIMACDVIFVVGGHTDYLMHVFNKTGFSGLLPKLLRSKVYVGSSAGSMVLAKRVSSEAYQKIYGETNDYGITAYLGLLDLAIKPHFGSADFPHNRPEVLDEVAGGMPFPVYGLPDDSAIVVQGDTQTFIGSKPYKVSQESLKI